MFPVSFSTLLCFIYISLGFIFVLFLTYYSDECWIQSFSASLFCVVLHRVTFCNHASLCFLFSLLSQSSWLILTKEGMWRGNQRVFPRELVKEDEAKLNQFLRQCSCYVIVTTCLRRKSQQPDTGFRVDNLVHFGEGQIHVGVHLSSSRVVQRHIFGAVEVFHCHWHNQGSDCIIDGDGVRFSAFHRTFRTRATPSCARAGDDAGVVQAVLD